MQNVQWTFVLHRPERSVDQRPQDFKLSYQKRKKRKESITFYFFLSEQITTMIKHKIFCTPEVMEQFREERTTAKGGSLIYSICKMRYRFYTMDGSYVDAIVVGEGMDSGDKATNKAMAAAFKYACFQTFCIPTEHLMDDPDAETPDASRKSNPSQDNERKSLMDMLAQELIRTGYGWNNVIVTYKVGSIDKMTIAQIKDCISKMKKQPDKEIPC